MRLAFGIAALLLAGSAPATAAPNVFWTFGFDFAQHGDRAPHFAAAASDRSYAGNSRPPVIAISLAALDSPSAPPLRLAAASAPSVSYYAPAMQSARLSPGLSGAAAHD